MKRITILLSVLFYAGIAAYGQKVQEVVVLNPNVGQGSISDSDKLFIFANIKNAFSKITGYRAFNGQSQAINDAEMEFQQNGNLSGEQVKKIEDQVGAAYICLVTLSIENNKLIVGSEFIDVDSGEKISDALLFSRGDKNGVMKQCQSFARNLLRDIQLAKTLPSKSPDNQKSDDIAGNQPASNSKAASNLSEPGVEINGVRWATRNVVAPGKFAGKPEDAGMFYQWNRSKGWEAAGAITGWNNSQSPGTAWSTTNRVCPAGYRLPTDAEVKSLTAGGGEWTTQNGVKGRVFGSGSNTIFMPATGYRYYKTGTLNDAGEGGYYWTGTQDVSEYAYHLYFGSGSSYRGNDYRSYGFAVRCVAE